jgi:signal transduction histidine kinase
MMKEKQAGEHIDNYEQMIERALSRVEGMRNLTMDLLDFTKIRLEKKKEKVSEVNVKELAKLSISTVKPYAIQKNVSIKLTVDPGLKMKINDNDLEIIFNNLLSNAVKYNNNDGRVDFDIFEQDGFIIIRVKDNGIGMTDEEMAGLFKEFSRVRNEKTKNISGSGLGLSIVRKITEIYKGKINVESQPDQGSTFTVSLPSV